MSKHHKHGNFNPNNRPQQQAPVETAADTAEATPAEVDALAASLNGEGETGVVAPELPEPTAEAEPPKVEEPVPPVVEQPPVVSAPKPVAVEAPAAPTVKILKISRVPAVTQQHTKAVSRLNEESPDDPSKHTTTGRQLLKLFDEYDALCAKTDKTDEQGMIRCAYKLYDIMQMCCPRRGNQNAGVYNEMIRIVFKRLSTGFGTKYSDASLFRQDYRLPSPVDSMKFDTFWSVMYQLVDAAKTGARISYNTETVSRILNSPSAMVTITAIRRRIEAAA